MSRVTLNRHGLAALLASPELEADLERRAEQVATAARSAGIRVEGEPGRLDLPVTVSASTHRRSRAQVGVWHASGLAVEAKHRVLGRSLDAARR